MPEPTHEAVFNTPPHTEPYLLFVREIGEETPDTPIRRLHADFFTPTYASRLNDLLLNDGYVVVSDWEDFIEWRIASLVRLNGR